MKQFCTVIILYLFLKCTLKGQNVGIGTNVPVNSALLELRDTAKGFLPPRLSSVQRDKIQNPAAGLLIWNIDCKEIQVYNGNIWVTMQGSPACSDSITTVTICSQKWMKKNLDVRFYRNGDSIPRVTDPIEWSNLTTGAWCWYKNDSATYAATYGRMYNWYAVTDPRGLAPKGWHIPGASEFTTLIDCLGGESVGGGKLKSVTGWISPNVGATNSTMFTGLPGGSRDQNGDFGGVGYAGYWWSAKTDGSFGLLYAFYFVMGCYDPSAIINSYHKGFGYSVRCIRD